MIEPLSPSVWERIRQFWDFPRIYKPRFLDDEEVKKEGMEDEIAGIRVSTNEVLINKKNLEERLGKEHTARVISHELGHYQYCPRGLRNYVRMVGHADLVTKNLSHAKLVQNLYADLCVNSRAFNKGDQGMVDLYKKLSEGNEQSDLWQLYMATYENMIGCQGMIIPPPKDEIKVQAKKLSDIVSSAMDQASKWPESVKEFAQVVKDYITQEEKQRKETEKSKKGSPQNNQGAQCSQPVPQDVPDIRKALIDEHKPQDFVPKNPNLPKEENDKKIEAELRGLSDELGAKEFKRVLSGLGITSSYQANIWLYRELASSYALNLPQIATKRSGEYKGQILKWTSSDPVSTLDYEYSLRRSPILIPGLTTYQRDRESGTSYGNSQNKPDLLIVIDSSLSMPDPKTEVSFPVLAAVIAADSALAYGSQVAVINFSTDYSVCDFTNQSKSIDEELVRYLGDSTSLPGEEMVRITSNHTAPIHTMIISDAHIHNLTSQLDNLEKALYHSGAGGSVFLCTNPSPKARKLEDIGYLVHFARDFQDLGDMTLEASKAIYGGI